ncbi:hypothetical protein U1Q18_028500 [Sarracenia purpurea var. burkii]
MNLFTNQNFLQTPNRLKNKRIRKIVRPQAQYSQLIKKKNSPPKVTILRKGLDHHIVDEQRRVFNVIEDFLGVMQVSKTWVRTEDHELVEGVHVLVEANPEDLGLDLFQFLDGFAVLEIKDAFLLGESCNAGGSCEIKPF